MILASRANGDTDVASTLLADYKKPCDRAVRQLTLKGSASVCFADALQERSAQPASLQDRTGVLLGALIGDTLGCTGEGKHPNTIAPFCRDLVPWPFVSQGSETLPTPPRGATHLGIQAILTLQALEDTKGVELDIGAVEKRLVEWTRMYHSSVFDAKTMASLYRLDGAAAGAAHNDWEADPHATSDAALTRNFVVSLAIDAKLAALTATVRFSLVTHSHPLEVLACVVQTELLQSALHLRHLQQPSPELFAVFLSGDKMESSWAQWKHDVDDPVCKAWLESHRHDLSRYETLLAAELATFESFNPFFSHNPTEARRSSNCVVRTLKTAIWALHWSCIGHFPPALLKSWIRHEDYCVPLKYRTRIEKERKMARAGLVPCVKRDHPGGNVWNPLDANGRFDAVMWVALIGGAATSSCMVAGALLAAYHGKPSKIWCSQVKSASLVEEMLRRVVGDACSDAASETTWLTEVTVPTDEKVRLARMVDYHIAQYERSHIPYDHNRRLLEHQAVEEMTDISLQIPATFTQLFATESHPCIRLVRHRREPSVEAFRDSCCERVGDPLEVFAELAASADPVVVYCADPGEVLGDYAVEGAGVGENQLFKRTTACLALWSRRGRDDGRLGGEANVRLPSREPAWPLTSGGVVYVPSCLLCKDRHYNMLPSEQRICCSAILMSHHNNDKWAMSEPRIVRKRMQNALEVAANNGHDVVIVPSFGYSFVENLAPSDVSKIWVEEASAYRHIFKQVIIMSQMDPVTGGKLDNFP